MENKREKPPVIIFLLNHSTKYAILIPVFFTFVVQVSILNGDFFSDDYMYFYRAANSGFWRFLFDPFANQIMPVRHVILYVFFCLFGLQASYYFILAFITHLLNVFFLYVVIKRITDNNLLAVFFSTLWGIALINRGTLEWFSAYGHVLATCFLLLILVDVSKLARGTESPGNFMLVRWSVLLVLSAFSWGVGIGIAVIFFISACFFLFHLKKRIRTSLIMLIPALLVILIYALIQRIIIWRSAADSFVFEFPYDNPLFWISSIKLFLAKLSYAVSMLLIGPFIINASHELIISYCITGLFASVMVYVFIKSSVYQRNLILGLMVLLLVTCGIFSFAKAWISEVLKLSFRSTVVSPWHYYMMTILVALLLGIACSLFIKTEKIKSNIIPISIMTLLLIVIFIASFVPAHYFYNKHGVNCKNEYYAIVEELKAGTTNLKQNESIYFRNKMTKSIRVPFQTDKNFDFPGLAAIYMIARFEGKFDGRNVYFIEENRALAKNLLADKDSAISKIILPVKSDVSYQVIDISY